MNEDNLLTACEYKVRRSGQSSAVEPVAIPHALDQSPDSHLGFSMFTSDSAHIVTALRRGEPVHAQSSDLNQISLTYPVSDAWYPTRRGKGTTLAMEAHIAGGGGREIWSFFSGAMGLDLGLELAGLPVTLANEINPVYCQTIRHNQPTIDLIEADVSTLKGKDLRWHRQFYGEVYLMVGGPPCQPFSSGGRRAALRDPRGNLIYEFFRLVSEIEPKYFLLENVGNLTTAALQHRPIAERPGQHWSLKRYEGNRPPVGDGAPPLRPHEMAGSALKQLLSDIGRLGYHVNFGVLDAADYGSPQHRLRFVMVGARDFPPPELPVTTHGPGLAPYTTVRDCIYDFRQDPGIHSEYTEPVRQFFSMIPPGGNWRALPTNLQRAALGPAFDAGGGKTGFYRRLAWDQPAPTVTGRANRKGSATCHPEFDRPLSVRECAALQGFPPDWVFEGAMNSQYMQVGNAVPVELGYAIGRALEEGRRQGTVIQQRDNEAMMLKAIGRLRAAGRNKRQAKAA